MQKQQKLNVSLLLILLSIVCGTPANGKQFSVTELILPITIDNAFISDAISNGVFGNAFDFTIGQSAKFNGNLEKLFENQKTFGMTKQFSLDAKFTSISLIQQTGGVTTTLAFTETWPNQLPASATTYYYDKLSFGSAVNVSAGEWYRLVLSRLGGSSLAPLDTLINFAEKKTLTAVPEPGIYSLLIPGLALIFISPRQKPASPTPIDPAQDLTAQPPLTPGGFRNSGSFHKLLAVKSVDHILSRNQMLLLIQIIPGLSHQQTRIAV
jgi:hypothetical protein